MLIFDGPLVHGFVVEVAGLLLALVAIRMRPGEAGFFSSLIRPIAIVAAVPALWMFIQVLPLRPLGLGNPIWESAAAALGRTLPGSISIDPGATLISLARYLSAAAIVFVAAAVAIDRNRAWRILVASTAATTMIALIILTANFGGFAFLSGSVGIAATNSASLGIILAAATSLHEFERGIMKSTDNTRSLAQSLLPLPLMASLVALAICLLAIFVDGASQTWFAISCGVATLVLAIGIRRFRLGPWGYAAIASVAIVVAISLLALQPAGSTIDLTLAFSGRAPASLIAVTQRILTETSRAGTGAGTFSSIFPIYRNMDELVIEQRAPTAAAAVAVDMGRVFLWAVLLSVVALVVTFLGGAARRGRDSIYAMAGAGCVVAVTLLAFNNAELFSTPVIVISAAVLGTAIAQRKSRSIQSSVRVNRNLHGRRPD